MITRAEIAALTPKGRTQLFDDLAGVLFPTQEATANALEITRRTVLNWRSREEVPLMALYALHSMAEAKLGAELAQVAESLDRTARILAQLVSPSAAPAPRESNGST